MRGKYCRKGGSLFRACREVFIRVDLERQPKGHVWSFWCLGAIPWEFQWERLRTASSAAMCRNLYWLRVVLPSIFPSLLIVASRKGQAAHNTSTRRKMLEKARAMAYLRPTDMQAVKILGDNTLYRTVNRYRRGADSLVWDKWTK